MNTGVRHQPCHVFANFGGRVSFDGLPEDAHGITMHGAHRPRQRCPKLIC